MGRQSTRRPSVTIHYAQTLDGRIATRTGGSQWLSGNASLHLAHELRAAHQVVLVGVGTIMVDNPRLTVRFVPGRSPLRVVADSTLRLPLDASVLVDGAGQTLIATTTRAPLKRIKAIWERGAEILVVDEDASGRVDLNSLFQRLGDRGVESILIEGGHGLITSALRERLVDRLIVCIVPKVMGTGIEAVGDLDVQRLSDVVSFAQSSFTALGEDIIFDGYLSDRSHVLSAEC